MVDTTQPIFCRSPTVAAAFLFTGASVVPTKSTKFGRAASSVGVPFGFVPTGFTFRVEPTPVIWVGLPSEEDTFNAVVGSLPVSLLVAGLAFSAFIATGSSLVTLVLSTVLPSASTKEPSSFLVTGLPFSST